MQTLQSIGGVPATIPSSWAMSKRYVTTLTAAGGVPWMVPLVTRDADTLRAIYEHLDGVFLPGGADIDPASYKEERHRACDTSDPARDEVELMFVRWAMEEQKPVLGVCRGLQIINLAAGGTLYQDLADQFEGSIKHDYFPFSGEFARDYIAHDVTLTPRTRLAKIFRVQTLPVNSMHHQGIRSLGDGLVVSALSPDGLIEGIEWGGDHWLVGVQWHPEVLTDKHRETRLLFETFIEQATGYGGRRLAGIGAPAA